MHTFSFPTSIHVGAGTIDQVAPALLAQGCARPLIVTDAHVVKLPFFQSLNDDLTAAGLAVAVFHEFSGNPILSHVEAGVTVLHEHNADSLVLLGGGAVLDVGKAMALMAHHPGELFDYDDGLPTVPPMDQPMPYIVAIPTTAGTGSEVGRSAVISENASKRKRIICCPRMLPQLVIADPVLTVGLPAHITAATGVDALTHLLEAFLVPSFHPMCDGIALEGIRLVAQHLVMAVNQPDDLNAREGMLVAAMMGAVAFQKGLGVNHSCAHALSTVFDMHHGLANAVMLPHCMAFNESVCPEKFQRIGQMVGCSSVEVVPWIRSVLQQVGIHQGLNDLGVAITEPLLDVAEADVCHGSNPRAVNREEFRQLFEAAF